jgi:hypothetical protein
VNTEPGHAGGGCRIGFRAQFLQDFFSAQSS